MKNASSISLMNRSGMKVELTVNWMSGPKGKQIKVTEPLPSNIINSRLFELDDYTEVTIEGKIGSNPTFLKFSYKHNAGALQIEIHADNSYSIN